MNFKFLTVQEMADIFRVKKTTIYQWHFYGKIKGKKINGKLLFTEDEINRLVA